MHLLGILQKLSKHELEKWPNYKQELQKRIHKTRLCKCIGYLYANKLDQRNVVGRLVDGMVSVEWLVGLLNGWLVGWLVGWLFICLFGWLVV